MPGADETLLVQQSLFGPDEVVVGRPDDDFYETPRWFIDALLNTIGFRAFRHCCRILDPGAGRGVLSRALLDWKQEHGYPPDVPAYNRPHLTLVDQDPRVLGFEVDQSFDHDIRQADIFEWSFDRCKEIERRATHRYKRVKATVHELLFDLILMNPPFKLWVEFVEAVLPMLGDGPMFVCGFMNLLGADKRREWWRNGAGRYCHTVWISTRRPKFKKKNPHGDMRDAAWFEFYRSPRRSFPPRIEIDYLEV